MEVKIKCILIAVLLLLLVTVSISAQSVMASSKQKSYAFRLKPHEDLKQGILNFSADHKMKAGCIVTAVGSLEQYNLRFANQPKGTELSGHFEIVALVGTFSETYAHLHLSVSDSTGRTIGGHLLEGNKVYTTAEIVILELTDLEFGRIKDDTYGYEELIIEARHK
jgi:predicted DNA-binding protein with PD1-like motif